MDKAEIEAENHYQGAAMCSQKGNPKKGGGAFAR